MSDSQPTPPRPGPLGCIGLGLLGSALVERCLRAGLDVVGFDVDPARRTWLTEAGGRVLGSASEVAQACRLLLLVLPDDRVTQTVLDEITPALAPRTVILDATTGDPELSAVLGRTLADRGLTYLDTTVSGSSVQARAGEALLLVGGPVEAFAQQRELFAVIARRAIHLGPCGSGARMKLVTNLILGLNRAVLAEGLVFAATLGLDAAKSLEVMKASVAYSRVMDSKGEKMLSGDFEPQARLSQHLKDVRLMLAAAERAGQKLPLSEVHRQLLEQAEHLGLGALDNSAVIRAIEARRETKPAG